MSQTNMTTTKILSTKNKKLTTNDKHVYTGKKVKGWKRDNTKRLPVEVY